MIVKVFRENMEYWIKGYIDFLPEEGSVPLEYSIFIRKDLKGADYYKTLKHELRHCQQMHEGILEQGSNWAKWDGILYSAEQLKRLGYNSRPWEVDARRAENSKAKIYLKDHNIISNPMVELIPMVKLI